MECRGGGTECPGGGLGGPAEGKMFEPGWERLRWGTGVHSGDGATTEKWEVCREAGQEVNTEMGRWQPRAVCAGGGVTKLEETGTGQGSMQRQFRFLFVGGHKPSRVSSR